MTAPGYTPPATSCVCRTSFGSGQPFCTYCSSSQPRNSRSFNCLAREPFIFGQQTMTKPTTRRLSSGSACETCRRRKTKCDGGQPCAYCATNGIECLHRASKKRSGQHLDNRAQTALMMGWPVPDKRTQRSISPQQDWLRIDPLRSSSRLGSSKSVYRQSSLPALKLSQPPSTPSVMDRIPSVTDQLSCRTFSAIAAIHANSSYPIYPLTSSHEHPRKLSLEQMSTLN